QYAETPLQITLKRINHLEPMPLEKVMESFEVKTHEELLHFIREMNEKPFDNAAFSLFRNTLINDIRENLDFYLPESFVLKSAFRDLGLAEEKTREEALNYVRWVLIIDKWKKEFTIQVTDEEIRENIRPSITRGMRQMQPQDMAWINQMVADVKK